MKRFEVQANSPAVLRYLLVQEDGSTPLVQSDISSLYYYVYDLDTETATTPEEGVDFAPDSVLYDTLQPWNVDDVGYNARVEVLASYLPTGGKTYRVEVKVYPTSGEPRYLEHVELTAIKTLSA
jgi:hypothetical protein